MDNAWVVDLVERLPQATMSQAWGWVADRRRPRLAVELLKRAFVKAVGVDMSEAQEEIGAYRTLGELFVRRLRSGARRIDPDPAAVICPVDGLAGACGRIEAGTLLQVKGRRYSVARLLDDAPQAARFDGGEFVTLYLSPRDYHRVHAPLAGEVAEGLLVPGALMPVFGASVDRVDELFARNERLVTYLDTPDAGRLAVVLVGATLVGRITVTYDPEIAANRGLGRQVLRYAPPRALAKGAELGAFHMGSTVVVLAEPGRLRLQRIAAGAPVRLGQRLGVIVERQPSRRRGGRAPAKRRGRERA